MANDMGGDVQQVRSKRVTVAGLGRFGGQIAVARLARRAGAHVLVTDQSPAEKLKESVGSSMECRSSFGSANIAKRISPRPI